MKWTTKLPDREEWWWVCLNDPRSRYPIEVYERSDGLYIELSEYEYTLEEFMERNKRHTVLWSSEPIPQPAEEE